jgi:D-glucosaminate-6-phosphate ammonia-lyase
VVISISETLGCVLIGCSSLKNNIRLREQAQRASSGILTICDYIKRGITLTHNYGSTRRRLFGKAGWGIAAGWLWQRPAPAAARAEQNIYQRIGVQPLINCKGTYTIISGSQSLPEVKKAMEEASHHYVHMDELMDGVGRRLAELTKAEWGMVSAGCAAALTHATAASICGANPEKMQRLPDTAGLKNEVVMMRQSRNVYDHAIRMTGAKMVTPATREEFLAAFGPKTAMVAVLGEALGEHPMQFPEMAEVAHKHGVPVIVDAAAERLTIPNKYLADGADMVAYSGGKCLRGPQCAGLLLGRKDLLQAAWINSAPHHAFGRSLKVAKEEIMGMLAAVEMWTKRDHDAEWKQWEGWLATIADAAKSVPGIRTEVLQPEGPSNFAPELRISWEGSPNGRAGFQRAESLLKGTPRIIVTPGPNSLNVMPYMMMPGDDKLAASRIREVLTVPPLKVPRTVGALAQVGGEWDLEVSYNRDHAIHSVFFEQKGLALQGTHRGEFLSADLHGSLVGPEVSWSSVHHYEGTSIRYRFEGIAEGDAIQGTVDVGEYGKAPITARRHFHA